MAGVGHLVYRRFSLVLLTIPLILLLASCSTETTGKFRGGGEVTIPRDETVDDDIYVGGGSISVLGKVNGDLVTAGGTIDLKGEVNGDLMAAGGSIDVSGAVNGDVTAAGGTVTIDGPVSDDVRVAGGSVVIRSAIGDDVIASGGRVTVSSEATVAGDLVVGAGEVRLDGTVEGDARFASGDVTISGTVKGNVEMGDGDLVLQSTARIEGDLTYTSRHEATVEPGAQVLGTTVRKTPTTKILWVGVKATGPMRVVTEIVGRVQWFLGTLLVGLLLLWLVPATFRSARNTLAGSPWKSLGLSILLLIVVPIVVIIAATISIFMLGFTAAPVAVVPVAIYIVLLALATPVVALFLGQYVLQRLAKRRAPAPWLGLVVGAALLAVAGFVPFLSGAVAVLALLFGFGAWLLLGYRVYSQARGAHRV